MQQNEIIIILMKVKDKNKNMPEPSAQFYCLLRQSSVMQDSCLVMTDVHVLNFDLDMLLILYFFI